MAINFPISPISGQTYDVGGVRYTYVYTSPTLGYWAVLEPGLTGPATDTDITNGTSPFKFVTPPQLKEVRDQALGAAYLGSLLEQDGRMNLSDNGGNASIGKGVSVQWGNFQSTSDMLGADGKTYECDVYFNNELKGDAWVVLLQPLDTTTGIAPSVKYILRSKGHANFTFTFQTDSNLPADNNGEIVWCWFLVGLVKPPGWVN